MELLPESTKTGVTVAEELRALIAKATNERLSDGGRYFAESCDDLTRCRHEEIGEYQHAADGELIEWLWNRRNEIATLYATDRIDTTAACKLEGLPRDGTCRMCGSTPRSPATGLCATCTDETASPAVGIPEDILAHVAKLGRVEWGQTHAHDAEGHGAHVAESVRKTAEAFDQTGDQHMHGLWLEGTETVLCHTGTSPNAPARRPRDHKPAPSRPRRAAPARSQSTAHRACRRCWA